MAKLSVVSLVACALVAATGAAAMPRDQQQAANKNVALAPPSPPTAQLTLEQYLAMPLEEREAIVELYKLEQQEATDNAASENEADNSSSSSADGPLILSKHLHIRIPHIHVKGPWSWMKCKICKKAIGFFEGKIADKGCGMASAYAVAACQAAGLGPLDPLSDICSAAFVAGCAAVAKDIEKHITDHHNLCKDIHLC